MIQVFTDSTADLGNSLAEKYNIHVIPLSVYIHGKTYQDGIDLTPYQLYDLVNQYGELPKTSALMMPDFLKAFTDPGEKIYIGLSSALSATIQNAMVYAKNLDLDTIRVVDSLNVSSGIGLLVLLAASMRDQGCSLDEIENAVLAARPRVKTSFMVDTLEYIYKGGRCTAIQSIVGSLLRIRPLLEVNHQGSLSIRAKLHGSRKKGLDTLLENFRKDLPNIDLSRIFITHSGCDADARYLSEEILRSASPGEVFITTAGIVISSHCGPNTIGIIYMLK